MRAKNDGAFTKTDTNDFVAMNNPAKLPTRDSLHRPSVVSRSKYAFNKKETIESFLQFARGNDLPRWPLEIFLEISNVCNLKCAMCPTFSALNPYRFLALRDTERGFIEPSQVQRPLGSLLSHSLNVHCFGYGEPTIHPDFYSFISEIADYEVLIDFFTNGMFLSPELCRFLVDKRIFSITVSFSGSSKEEYENVYIGAVYEQVLGGIERLAREKASRGSTYPIIEINSLSFEHHILSLDRFVNLMADHGANLIHVKALQAHSFIPQLAGHASIFRPWIEGEIIQRALELAKSRDIGLSCTQYLQTAVQDESEWKLAKEKQYHSQDLHQTEPLIQISRFKESAKDVEVHRPKADKKIAPPLDIYAEDISTMRAQMQIGSPSLHSEPFYCFEPFKTVYLNRNGNVKPCCFANDNAASMGNVEVNDGRDIWNGPRYQLFRESIIRGEYPLGACGSCLKGEIGPKHHFSHDKIAAYLKWYRSTFQQTLLEDPADELISLGNNTDIIERYRRKHSLEVERRQPQLISKVSHVELPKLPDELSPYLEKLETRARMGVDCSDIVRGHFDRIEGGKLIGWLWTPLFPQIRLPVAFYADDILIGVAFADKFRYDLMVAGIGDGKYSFEFKIPSEMQDGEAHQFQAKLPHSSFFLRSTPLIAKLG